jgi:hypothetical protein
MANAKSLAGLMNWLHREEWHNSFDELRERHLGRACTKAGIAIEELADVLGEQHSSVLWGCVFEDLLARDLDDGRNIVDDYLRRRGWKESAPRHGLDLHHEQDPARGRTHRARYR